MTSAKRRHTGNTGPLSWRHPLEQREPAVGFASRLASLNGLSMRVFLREMQISALDLDKSRESAINALARLGGLPTDALAHYTPRPFGKSESHVGLERLHRLSVRRTYFSYCPLCIGDDIGRYQGPIEARPWLRLEWLIPHFRSCCKHNTKLLVTTPIRRRYEPFDFSEWIKQLLPEMEGLKNTVGERPPSPFQQWLRRRLDGFRDSSLWIDQFELFVAVDFCESLGLSSLQAPKVLVTSLTEMDMAAAADEGFRIAGKGFEGIEQLYERQVRAQATTRGFWGPRDTFGLVYGMLDKKRDIPEYNLLRNHLRQFCVDNMPIEPGTVLLGEEIRQQRVHTIRSAARLSRTHNLTIRKIFERKRLSDESTLKLMDHRVTVSSHEIESLLHSLRDSLTTPKIEHLTGIPRLHLRHMISAGHLPTLTGSKGTPYAKHRFSNQSLNEMLGRLYDGAEIVSKPHGRQMPILQARQASVSGLHNIIDLVFEKRIWKGLLNGKREYSSILVDTDEVIAKIRADHSRNGLTKAEAAKYIPGMARDSVQQFIVSGHLKLEMEFSPEARRNIPLVTRESADLFQNSYVSLGELSNEAGLHHKQIRSALRSVGIETSFDPEKFKCFFYERSSVKTALKRDPEFLHSGVKKRKQ